MYQELLNKKKLNRKTYDYFKKKYDRRSDPDNLFGVGMSDREFTHFIINELLGEDWYVVDPISHDQVNECAFLEILSKYRKQERKSKKMENKKISFRCEVLNIHKPIKIKIIEDKYVEAVCKRCGRQLMMDGSGDWYPKITNFKG